MQEILELKQKSALINLILANAAHVSSDEFFLNVSTAAV